MKWWNSDEDKGEEYRSLNPDVGAALLTMILLTTCALLTLWFKTQNPWAMVALVAYTGLWATTFRFSR